MTNHRDVWFSEWVPRGNSGQSVEFPMMSAEDLQHSAQHPDVWLADMVAADEAVIPEIRLRCRVVPSVDRREPCPDNPPADGAPGPGTADRA